MKIFAVFSMFFAGTLSFASSGHLHSESRILIIGDSHSVGPFGHLLVDELKQVSSRTSLYASCGTVASSWFAGSKTRCGFYFKTEQGKTLQGRIGNTPKLPGMLATLKPDLLVVGLSGNYSKGFDEAAAIADMKKVINLIKDQAIACLWVSAPDSRINRTERSKLFSWVMQAVGDRCTVVDGRAHTHYPENEGDGIHYFRESDVREWVDAVVSEAKLILKESSF
jgi:hypothetical protein